MRGDATQEREFQPKCSRFPYGMLSGRKELPCKSAWARTRSVASSGRPLTKSPMRFPEGRGASRPLDGLEATRRIKQLAPATKVVVLSALRDQP